MSEWKPTNNPKDALGTAKAPLHLIPQTALVAASMAFLEGREKYGQYNWRITGVRASVYQAALLRHMAAWFDGEYIDPDSGLPHLWKAIACLAILIDADELDVLEDDRPPRAPTAELMDETKHMGESIRARLADYDPFQYTELNRHEGPQEDPGPRMSGYDTDPVSGVIHLDHPIQGEGVPVRHEETLGAMQKRLEREAEEHQARHTEDERNYYAGLKDTPHCPVCARPLTFVDRVPNTRAVEYRCSDHGVFVFPG